MDTKIALLSAALVVSLSGCETFGGGPKKATMTLEEAICTVQNSLLRTKRPKETQAGLKPIEALVSLNIGFKETKGGTAGAKLKLGIVEWAPGGSYSRENTTGNVLQIKFGPSDDGPYFWAAGAMQMKTADGRTQNVDLPKCEEFQNLQ